MLTDRDTDAYVSRVEDHPRMTDRQDPVIWGSGAPGPLTPTQVEAYRDDGYLFLPDFFGPDETARIRQEKDRLWSAAARETRPEVIREPDSDLVRSIFAVHRDDPYFGGLAADGRLTGIARQILGSDVYIHQSRVNFKAGFSGQEFYWHSDFETWHVEDGMPRMRALSMSIALTENLPTNGPLMIMPGSHQIFVACVGKTPENHFTQSLRRQVYGTPDPESLTVLADRRGIAMPTGGPGSVLVFDCNIMHGSNSNITPYPRSNLFLVYNSVENRLQEPYSGQPPRPRYIATR